MAGLPWGTPAVVSQQHGYPAWPAQPSTLYRGAGGMYPVGAAVGWAPQGVTAMMPQGAPGGGWMMMPYAAPQGYGAHPAVVAQPHTIPAANSAPPPPSAPLTPNDLTPSPGSLLPWPNSSLAGCNGESGPHPCSPTPTEEECSVSPRSPSRSIGTTDHPHSVDFPNSDEGVKDAQEGTLNETTKLRSISASPPTSQPCLARRSNPWTKGAHHIGACESEIADADDLDDPATSRLIQNHRPVPSESFSIRNPDFPPAERTIEPVGTANEVKSSNDVSEQAELCDFSNEKEQGFDGDTGLATKEVRMDEVASVTEFSVEADDCISSFNVSREVQSDNESRCVRAVDTEASPEKCLLATHDTNVCLLTSRDREHAHEDDDILDSDLAGEAFSADSSPSPSPPTLRSRVTEAVNKVKNSRMLAEGTETSTQISSQPRSTTPERNYGEMADQSRVNPTVAHRLNAIAAARRLPKDSVNELDAGELLWVKNGKDFLPAKIAPCRATGSSVEARTTLRVVYIPSGTQWVSVSADRCLPFLTAFDRCVPRTPHPELEEAVETAKLEAHVMDISLDPQRTDVGFAPLFDPHDEEERRQEFLSMHGKRSSPVSGDILDYAAQLASFGGRGDPTLISLNLGGRKICTEGFKVLAKSLKFNTRLRELFLYNTGMTYDAVKMLTKALKSNYTLSSLNLGENLFCDKAVNILLDHIKENPAIAQLYMDWGVTNAAVKVEMHKILSRPSREELWRSLTGAVPENFYKGTHDGFRGSKTHDRLVGKTAKKSRSNQQERKRKGTSGSDNHVNKSARKNKTWNMLIVTKKTNGVEQKFNSINDAVEMILGKTNAHYSLQRFSKAATSAGYSVRLATALEQEQNLTQSMCPNLSRRGRTCAKFATFARVKVGRLCGTITEVFGDGTAEVTYDNQTRETLLPTHNHIQFLANTFNKDLGRVRLRQRKSGDAVLSAFAFLEDSDGRRREISVGLHSTNHLAVKAIAAAHDRKIAPPRPLEDSSIRNCLKKNTAETKRAPEKFTAASASTATSPPFAPLHRVRHKNRFGTVTSVSDRGGFHVTWDDMTTSKFSADSAHVVSVNTSFRSLGRLRDRHQAISAFAFLRMKAGGSKREISCGKHTSMKGAVTAILNKHKEMAKHPDVIDEFERGTRELLSETASAGSV